MPQRLLVQHFLSDLKEKNPPHRETSQTNPHWKLVDWFLCNKSSLETRMFNYFKFPCWKLVDWLLYNTILY